MFIKTSDTAEVMMKNGKEIKHKSKQEKARLKIHGTVR